MRTWQFERDPMRELLALLSEPDAFIDSLIGESGWTIEPRDRDQDISLALFVSARDVHRGVSVLLGTGRAQDAWILYRTLLDATATLMWFSHNPSELSRSVRRYSWTSLKRADEFVKAARAKNLKWAQTAIDERGREMANLVATAREDGIDLAREPMPGTSELLTAVEQEDLYFWHARAGLTVHPTFYGLSGRVGLPEGGKGRIRSASRGACEPDRGASHLDAAHSGGASEAWGRGSRETSSARHCHGCATVDFCATAYATVPCAPRGRG